MNQETNESCDEQAMAQPQVPASEVLTPEQEAQHAMDAMKDQLLRLAADYDNFRKRSRKEVDDMRLYGIERIASDFLSVLDNLDRALAHAKNTQDPVMQGILMVAKQFTDVMATHGVAAFAAMGEAFDPERHEAIGQCPSDQHPQGVVMEEVQKGYTIHQRLLRPAKVIVSSGPVATV